MKRDILFIHGGGERGYEADAELAASLKKTLKEGYSVHYPEIKSDETSPCYGWVQQIGKEISCINGEVIIAGHSFGASMLLKFLSENKVKQKVGGIFLISTPFWSGNEDWVKGLKLNENFGESLPVNVPVFLYHSLDDEEIPFEHLLVYEKMLPYATIREIESGGHQLNNDLTIVAQDIKSL